MLLDCVPSIESQDEFWSDTSGFSSFPAQNVLVDACDSRNDMNYWLAPDQAQDVGFIVKRNCADPLNMILLKNTHNGRLNDRYVN